MAKPARHRRSRDGFPNPIGVEMKRWGRKLVMTFVVVLMALSAGGFAAAAHGAPPARQSATISTDGKLCEVTATFTWKNYDPATLGSSAYVELRNVTIGSSEGISTFEPLAGSDTLTLTLKGQPGNEYQAAGGLTFSDGTWQESESKVATLRCQAGGPPAKLLSE
jgi:hypothetical protein